MGNRILRWLAPLFALFLSFTALGQGMPTGAQDSFNRMNSISFKYQLGTLLSQALGTTAGGVTLTNGDFLVGNASNVATAVAMSGDVTMTNAGVTTVGAGAITATKLANNTITTTQLALNVAQYTASITLAQTDLTAIHTTPKSLIAAPGAGKLIMVDEVQILHTYSTAAYTTCGKVQIQYHGSTDIMDLAAAVLTGSTTHTYVAQPLTYEVDNSTGSTPQNLDGQANLGVDFTAATADCAAGNAGNILKVQVKYRVLTVLT